MSLVQGNKETTRETVAIVAGDYHESTGPLEFFGMILDHFECTKMDAQCCGSMSGSLDKSFLGPF